MNFFKLSILTTLLVTVSIGSAIAETIRISVPEMECDNCSKAIKDRLKLEKDITKVSIDLKERVVTVNTADSAKVTDERLNALIKDSGFEAKSIERVN